MAAEIGLVEKGVCLPLKTENLNFDSEFEYVIFSILKKMDVSDIVKVSSVLNRQWHKISLIPRLWAFLIKRDFGLAEYDIIKSSDENFRSGYIRLYKKYKELVRLLPGDQSMLLKKLDPNHEGNSSVRLLGFISPVLFEKYVSKLKYSELEHMLTCPRLKMSFSIIEAYTRTASFEARLKKATDYIFGFLFVFACSTGNVGIIRKMMEDTRFKNISLTEKWGFGHAYCQALQVGNAACLSLINQCVRLENLPEEGMYGWKYIRAFNNPAAR